MWFLLIPFGGLVFVVATFGALDPMRRGEDWTKSAIAAGFAFAVMVTCWAMLSSY